jgi:CheY-like chemotaxis protein
LRQARADAEAGSAAKSDFLSSMSHELRTPLNAILGFAQLLQRSRTDPLSNQHKARVEHILKGGEHLLRLINDILDLSHIESGGISISPEPVDVLAVLDEVRLTLQPMAESHLVRLGVEIAGASLPAVLADRTRFAQILMNFGSNAIKYNRKDGCVVFRVSAVDPAFVRVVVVDDGIGIPADKQHMLFQPFQRAGQETGPIEGSGIGLVVTRRLAELMGGRVGFASKPGEGSEFWVEMPAHSEAASHPPPVAAGRTPSQPVQGSLQHPLVLYVEDNEANTSFMRDLLDAYDGVELVTTQTAEQGIECARQRQPSVVIMDINLPGMSGLQALTALRAFPETRSIPVIALTAAASERDKQRGEQAGFYRYLTKPVRVDELEEALDSVLRSPHP